LVLLFIFKSAAGQTLNKKYIDDWVIKCDTSIKLSKINLYSLRGRVYEPNDSIKLNTDLENISFSKLLSIDFYRTEDIIPTTGAPGKIIVLIAIKGNQSTKQKRKFLEEAITKYNPMQLPTNHIPSDSKEPVLLINGKEIFHSDCYRELLKMRKNYIYAVDIYMHQVPQEYYGQNAKNGLIQIWTHP